MSDGGYNWLHSWSESDGETVLACARYRDEYGAARYLLRFPELADFVISDNIVTCYPQPGCREDTLRHLVLDQVIPRVWAHRGRLVLHASAVQLPNGRVVAFLGESGWGKSTLAAALQLRGSRLLSDDSICLRPGEDAVKLIPAYAGLRLNDDSIADLGLVEQDWAGVCHYSDKRRVEFATGEFGQDFFLDTLFVMEEPADIRTISIQPTGGAGLVTAIIKRSFLLDVRDIVSAARQLEQAAASVGALAKVYSLDYPRSYRDLPLLCDTLLASKVTGLDQIS